MEITIHTYLVLFLHITPPAWISVVVIAFSWILLLLVVLATIGPLLLQKDSKGPFYDSSGA